jgi:hypothetical protein
MLVGLLQQVTLVQVPGIEQEACGTWPPGLDLNWASKFGALLGLVFAWFVGVDC